MWLIVCNFTLHNTDYCTHFYFSELESEVEMVRLDVVQKRCIGNPAEVDSLNSQLSLISRQVSDLKSKYRLHIGYDSSVTLPNKYRLTLLE